MIPDVKQTRKNQILLIKMMIKFLMQSWSPENTFTFFELKTFKLGISLIQQKGPDDSNDIPTDSLSLSLYCLSNILHGVDIARDKRIN